MFSILSETLMTASRLDGFRYTDGRSLMPNRLDPRDAEFLRSVVQAGKEQKAPRQPL